MRRPCVAVLVQPVWWGTKRAQTMKSDPFEKRVAFRVAERKENFGSPAWGRNPNRLGRNMRKTAMAEVRPPQAKESVESMQPVVGRAAAAAAARHGLGSPLSSKLLVQLTTEELLEGVANVVAAVVADAMPQEQVPTYLAPGPTAKMFDISRPTLNRLRMQGAPCLRVGDTVRYDPAKLIAWLEQRAANE